MSWLSREEIHFFFFLEFLSTDHTYKYDHAKHIDSAFYKDILNSLRFSDSVQRYDCNLQMQFIYPGINKTLYKTFLSELNPLTFSIVFIIKRLGGIVFPKSHFH